MKYDRGVYCINKKVVFFFEMVILNEYYWYATYCFHKVL
jgi:hypothetical protein